MKEIPAALLVLYGSSSQSGLESVNAYLPLLSNSLIKDAVRKMVGHQIIPPGLTFHPPPPPIFCPTLLFVVSIQGHPNHKVITSKAKRRLQSSVHVRPNDLPSHFLFVLAHMLLYYNYAKMFHHIIYTL